MERFAAAMMRPAALGDGWAQVRDAVMLLGVILATAPVIGAQERYVSAVENQAHELVITTAAGRRVVLPKGHDPLMKEDQEKFDQILISPDGRAVAWLAYYPNCCTSYPIPRLVEVFSGGRRRTFEPAIVAWDWCFVDGSSKLAARSSTVHGTQNEILQLWDIASGALLEDFTWMDGGKYPRAPAWVLALRAENARDADSKTHICTTKP
jgi:hypothetical protein